MSQQKQEINQLRQRLAQNNIIVDATRHFTSTLDSNEIQQALFEAVFQIVGAQQIALHLNNEKGLESTVCYPMEGLRAETAVLPPNATAFCICAEGKQVIWHHDDDNQTTPPISVEAIEQFSSYLALPLKGAERIVGVIEAFNLLEPHNFEQQAALLTDIAGPAGLAIYNSMLYQEAQNEIAERSRIEATLKKSEEMSKTLLEAIMLPLLVTRISDGTVIYANEQVADLVGLPGDEVVGKQTPNFYANPEDRLVILEAIRKHGGVDNMQLPIRRIDGEIIWVVLSNRPIIYDGEEAILTSLVDISARKAAEDALALRADELETVSRVSASAATILEKDRLLQEVVDLTKERFNLYHAHIYLLDAISEQLILTAGAGEIGEQMVAERHVIPLNKEQSLVAQVARTKQGLIENDVCRNPSFLPHPLLPETRAEMAVPMLVGDRIIGVLDVHANEVNCFTEHNVSVMSTLAAQISVALENARSFEEAQSALAETEFLLTITQETSGSFDLHQSLTKVLDKTLESVGMDAGLFSIIDKNVDSLALLANYLPEVLLQSLQEKGLDNTLCDLVYRSGEPIILPNLEENAPLDVSGLIDIGFKSYQGVPLVVGGTVLGTLCMFGKDRLPPESINLRLLSVIGQKIGTAVQTVRLFEQSQRQAQELQIVADLSTQTTLIHQPQSFLEAVVQETQRRFNLYHCHVFILDESGEHLQIRACGWEAGSEHEGTHGTAVIPLSAEKSLVAQAARTRKPVVVNDVFNDPNWLPNELLPNTRSEMAVPMIAGGQLMGVLDIQSEKKNRFSEQDEQIQLTLAAQTAVALQNARHLAQAEKHARDLEFINRIVSQMNAAQDADTGLQFMVDELGSVLQVPLINVRLIDDTGTMLKVVAARHPAETPSPVGTVIPVGKNPAGNMLLSQQTVIIEDIANSNLPPQVQKRILEAGICSLYVIPMMVGQDLIGSVAINLMEGGSLLTPDQLRLAETTVQQAATAVQTVRQFDEIQRSQASLRRSEADLSEALRLAKLGYWEFDVEKDLFTFNDQFYALFHTTAEEHGGYQLSSAYYAEHFVYPDDLPVVGTEIERALNSTELHYSASVEHRILYADGGVGYISVNINLERDEDGNILHYYGANQDITERKRIEEAVAKQAQKLARLNEMSAALNQSDSLNEIYQVVGQFMQEIFEGDRASFASLEPDGKSFEVLGLSGVKGAIPSGTKIPVSGSGVGLAVKKQRLVRFPQDEPMDKYLDTKKLYADGIRAAMCVPLVVNDITIGSLNIAAKTPDAFGEPEASMMLQVASLVSSALQAHQLLEQVQNALEDANTFKQLVQVAGQGIGMADFEGNMTYINPSLSELMDVPFEQAVGHPMFPYYPPAIQQQFQTEIIPTVMQDGQWRGELQMDINGRLVPTFENYFLIQDEAGNPVQFAAMISDITERKAAEEKLAKQADELQIVADLSVEATIIQDAQELLETIVQEAQVRFNLYHVHVFLMDNARKTLRIQACGWHQDSEHYGEHGDAVIAVDAEQSLVAQAARTKKAVIVNNVLDNPNWLPNKLLPDTRAEMAVPMIAQGRVIGVIDFQATEANYFTAEDVQVKTTLAAQLAIALENARSFEQAQTAVSEMNALTRRLTREGWQEFLAEKTSDEVGFVYNPAELNSIAPLVKAKPNGAAIPDSVSDAANNDQFVRTISVLGESIGQISIVPDEDESDTDDELTEIMTAVTQRLSDHLENLRLSEQTQTALSQTEQQAERLSMLNEMGAELSRADMLDEILDIGVKHTAKILVADRVTLGILTPEREHIEFVASWGEDEMVESGVIIPIGMNKTMKTAVRENRVIMEQKITLQTFDDMKSFMTAPLAGDNRVIGVINVGNLHPNYFTRQDQSLILQISSLLGAAIERQRLAELTKAALDETQKRSEELALINRVMAAVTGSLDLTKNMQIIARELAQAISVSHVGIALMTEDKKHLEVVTEFPLPEPGSPQDSIGQLLPIKGNPLTEQALDTRKFAIAYDAQNNPLTAPIHDLMRQREIATLAVLPMAMGDEIFGTVGFDLTDPDRMITDEQMRLAETIVYHTTTVVQNARLFAQTEQRLADLLVIQRTVSDLTEAQSTQDALEALTPKLMSAVDADSVTIYDIKDEQMVRLIQYPELPSEFMAKTQIMPLARLSVSEQAVQSRQPVLFTADSPGVPPEQAAYMQAAGIYSTALVPLASQEGIVGVMFANMHQKGKIFTQHDTGLLQTLANQASIALDRIRLLEETRQRARREQLLREIAAKVRSTTQVDGVMRTAVQEVGRALGRKTFLYLDQSANPEQNPDKDA